VSDDGGGAETGEEGGARRPGEALVDRQHGVAVVPRPPQGVDPRRAPGQIDCDEAGHGR
jgi:hypothetical protein